VLSRISSVLRKFLTPLAAGSRQALTQAEPNHTSSFDRAPNEEETQPTKQEDTKKQLKLVVHSDPNQSGESQTGGQENTGAFTQLVSLLQEKKGNLLLKSSGLKRYKSANKDQKKNSKFKKGAMFDYEAK
jgi:hypothetical protein